MAHIRFASHLKQFFPKLCALEIDAATVAEVLRKLETIHPGLSSYLVDEHGAMRKHV
ncbi:MAG TPA: molybdenum cofactor biosynthesis protein MoaD, partial [Bacteroidetes bacterium]|nr:molybdenum cofactor biosynthesis protein MoaD [Bacteroidota bacterium]